jgi:hypothetical protein
MKDVDVVRAHLAQPPLESAAQRAMKQDPVTPAGGQNKLLAPP